jgi:hypothetical protein
MSTTPGACRIVAPGRKSPGSTLGVETQGLEDGRTRGDRMTTFMDFVWGFILFFFWFMALWVFIQVFADIFRRRDLSGMWKAIWVVVLFVLPFLGAIVYLIARPAMTDQDREELARAQEAKRRIEGYSSADEIAKLAALRDAGTISAEEFEQLKTRALVTV